MALSDREDDGLTKQWLSQHTVAIDVTAIQHLPELSDDRPVALRYCEAPFQRCGIDRYWVMIGEELVKLRASRIIYR